MSFDASGSLGGAVVFSKWKGRPYVRQLVTPSNPQSASQMATRAMMAFLTSAWRFISAPDQATWLEGGDGKKISAFNHYVSVNMKRWTQFQAPGQSDPPEGTGTPAAEETMAAVGGVRQATINVTDWTPEDTWGYIIYAKLGGAPTGIKTETDQILNTDVIETVDGFTTIVTELEPGTWYFLGQPFTKDGKLGEATASANCIVT